MKIIKVTNELELSKTAGEMIAGKVRSNPEIVLGLATGGTPVGTYKYMIEDHKTNGTSYSKVSTVNLDEYIGLQKSNPNSYYSFMKETLFDHIDINQENTFIPDGNASDLEAECANYEKRIAELGGVDLQLLGIGRNGHIAFNEPGTSFDSRTQVVPLTKETIEDNARFFSSREEVPTKAISMGIQTILESKEIILLATGKSKADAMSKLINGEVTEDFPASALQKHSNVTIIADEEALSLVKE
ncbi:glucosamine-6-phosphate deaminase [Neobacillus notoginsengisoli]|uniref:Glucosamine-6-phosphate deaminase n=1 Tax=Neobacillus notoginsengisoli TaxID=1578198 RepID=A0A417YSF0_9BACI|nr:glucosamine-6-phosphate deaminase [Neobacillus notoginsengisoli]RHW38913.1 glucosamine-6-phosphate deaminase [Neobacillus notoginsengisoli]